MYTVIGAMMSHRKWRETKQQLILWPDLTPLGCSLVSIHFQCDILATITVYIRYLLYNPNISPSVSMIKPLLALLAVCWVLPEARASDLNLTYPTTTFDIPAIGDGRKLEFATFRSRWVEMIVDIVPFLMSSRWSNRILHRKVFNMLFDRCHSKKRKSSIKQHNYFDFLCKIQLDKPVER